MSRTSERRILPALFVFGVLLLTFLVCTSPASAQNNWEVFIEGGGSFWNAHNFVQTAVVGTPPIAETLRLTTNVESSGRLFAGLRVWVDRDNAFEASFSYALADVVSQSCNPGCGPPFPSSGRIYFFAANYVHQFQVGRHLRPFLTSGPGLVYVRQVGTNEIFQPDRLAVNLGVGVDIPVARHWFLRIEDREWVFETPRQSDSFPAGMTGLAHNQVPSVGFGYRF